MKVKKTGNLSRNVAALSAFVKAAGKTIITGMAQTAAERQIERLPAGRMRLWASHVRLYIDDAIVLGLDDLVADVQVGDPELPLIPERTDQYTFHILAGKVRLKAEVIATLLARYVLTSVPVGLSEPKIILDERGMRLEAKLSWGLVRVPVVLAGPVTLSEGGSIQLTIARAEAAGWGLGPLLTLLRTDIERVLRLPDDGPMSARGNALMLDPEQILPSPRAKGRPVAVRVEDGAMVLSYEWPEPLATPPLIEREAPAFLFCLGHTLLIGKMFLDDVVFQIVPRASDAIELDFSLLCYRKQLAAGESTLKQHGELLVRLPNVDAGSFPDSKK